MVASDHPFIPDPEALAAARAISDAQERARALVELASGLSDAEREAVLREALAAARVISDARERAQALTELAPRLPATEHQAVLREALYALWSVRDRALAQLASHSPDEALAAARAISDAHGRAHALGELARHLPATQRGAVLDEAIDAIQGEIARVSARDATRSPGVGHQALLDDALTAARAISDAKLRSDTLAEIAQQLPDNDHQTVTGEALDAARAISDAKLRLDTLRTRSGALRRVRSEDMPRRAQFFHPFDVTYGEISRRVRRYLPQLASIEEADWLQNIMWHFQLEADQWDDKIELEHYRRLMSDLRLKIIQLAAGAYLHIAYDLPRVLANYWPGEAPNDPPSNDRGVAIYGFIGSFFPDVIDDVRIMPEVVGVSGRALKWLLARRAMKLWITNLRNAAWLHAQQLKHCSTAERRRREQLMLRAITDALEETSTWMPWEVLNLSSPPFFYEEEPTHPVLLSLPFIPFEIETGDFQLPIEVIGLLFLMILIFVAVRHSAVLRKQLNVLARLLAQQQNLLEIDYSRTTNTSADADEITPKSEEIVAEFINRLGSSIERNLRAVFEQPSDG